MSSVEVDLSASKISSVSSAPSELVPHDGSLRFVSKLEELAIEAISLVKSISWIGSPLWFNSFLFLTLSLLAFAALASLSLGFLNGIFSSRLRVGTRSMLWTSQSFAALPETKWRPLTRYGGPLYPVTSQSSIPRYRGHSLFLCPLHWSPQSNEFFLLYVLRALVLGLKRFWGWYGSLL